MYRAKKLCMQPVQVPKTMHASSTSPEWRSSVI